MKRKKPHSSALVILLVLIFGAWWGVSVLAHYSRVGTQITAGGRESATYTQQHPLEVTVTQSEDTLTYEGSFALPACESLGSGITIQGKTPHVALVFMSSKTSIACAQAATLEKNPFSLSIDIAKGAAAPAFDGVYFNDKKVPSTLVASH
jgi:hypothetical protein